jgi:uncharacterized protein (DUF924 family)
VGINTMNQVRGAKEHDPNWVDEVLRFWFRELTREQWFAGGDALDGQIRSRFLAVHRMVAAARDELLLSDAKTALAAVIVLDQFSRNMFRGTPAAFESDAKALALAKATIAMGMADALGRDERLFLYLPFEHHEDAASQARCVELMSALGDPELTKFAQAHKDIIDRFGRFPHRNAILGRQSTAEEVEFLRGPGSAF